MQVTIGAKWLSSLEAGRRMVLSCFIVIMVLAGVCSKLYFEKIKSDKRYEKLQDRYISDVGEIERKSNDKIQKIQQEAALKYETFVLGQLAKQDQLQDQYNEIIFRNNQVTQHALKNNVQLKTLIRHEQNK